MLSLKLFGLSGVVWRRQLSLCGAPPRGVVCKAPLIFEWVSVLCEWHEPLGGFHIMNCLLVCALAMTLAAEMARVLQFRAAFQFRDCELEIELIKIHNRVRPVGLLYFCAWECRESHCYGQSGLLLALAFQF